MPFMEISDFGGSLAAREVVAKDGTEALVTAYGISPEIVTCYFHDSTDSYAHAGKFGSKAEKKRVFVKVHAFRRAKELQNRAAELLTAAFATGYDLPAQQIAIYFVDRDEADAYHGGISAADAK